MAKKKPIEVAEWISDGNIGEATRTWGDVPPEDEDAILGVCGNLLDDACSHDILGGGILFRATNGKYYTVSVEAVIAEAHPQFVRERLTEQFEALDPDADAAKRAEIEAVLDELEAKAG